MSKFKVGQEIFYALEREDYDTRPCPSCGREEYINGSKRIVYETDSYIITGIGEENHYYVVPSWTVEEGKKPDFHNPMYIDINEEYLGGFFATPEEAIANREANKSKSK